MRFVAGDIIKGASRHCLAQRVLADHVPVGKRDLLSTEVADCLLLQPLGQALDRGLMLGVGFLVPFLKRFEPPFPPAGM